MILKRIFQEIKTVLLEEIEAYHVERAAMYLVDGYPYAAYHELIGVESEEAQSLRKTCADRILHPLVHHTYTLH